jgi:hypothetical protein
MLLVAAPAAAAGGQDAHRDHPGYVDGSKFVDLADPDGRLIEVTLHGRLLRLLTHRAIRRHDETLADILEGLESMQAVIAEIPGVARDDDDDDPEARLDLADLGRTHERAKETVTSLGARLQEDGWDRFVRVREQGGEELLAFAHVSKDEEIDGLVVMGMTGGSELLFVNIAGRIDMEAVAVLGERFGLPGLDGLPGDEEIRDAHRKREKVARGRGVPDRVPSGPARH